MDWQKVLFIILTTMLVIMAIIVVSLALYLCPPPSFDKHFLPSPPAMPSNPYDIKPQPSGSNPDDPANWRCPICNAGLMWVEANSADSVTAICTNRHKIDY